MRWVIRFQLLAGKYAGGNTYNIAAAGILSLANVYFGIAYFGYLLGALNFSINHHFLNHVRMRTAKLHLV